MRHSALAFICISFALGPAAAADPPQAGIANQYIKAKLYLPDAQNGFYRGTRFDWSGVIYSLDYQGHNFYGPWFTKYDPAVRDFVYKDADIIVGSASAMVGPVDEFQRPLGYDTAKPGETFVKIEEKGGVLQTVLREGVNFQELLQFLRGMAVMAATFAWSGTWSRALLSPIFTAPIVIMALVAFGSWLWAIRRWPIEGQAPLFVAGPFLLGLIYHQIVWSLTGAGIMAGTPGWHLQSSTIPSAPITTPSAGQPRRRSSAAAPTVPAFARRFASIPARA